MLNKIVLLELQDQVLKWKRKASKVAMANIRLARYDTIFKEHTLLRLEAVAWQQHTRKKEVKWNKFKGEVNAILNDAPLFTLIDETPYHQ
jgi:hypothetical protein